jgi:hypothetical protein
MAYKIQEPEYKKGDHYCTPRKFDTVWFTTPGIDYGLTPQQIDQCKSLIHAAVQAEGEIDRMQVLKWEGPSNGKAVEPVVWVIHEKVPEWDNHTPEELMKMYGLKEDELVNLNYVTMLLPSEY